MERKIIYKVRVKDRIGASYIWKYSESKIERVSEMKNLNAQITDIKNSLMERQDSF